MTAGVATSSSLSPMVSPLSTTSLQTRLLHSATALAFPDYPQPQPVQSQPVQQQSRQTHATSHPTTPSKIMSSLPLQVLLFYHGYYSLIWVVGMSYMVYWKHTTYAVSAAFVYVTPVLVALFAVVEWARIRLGKAGNLGERVPELAGFLLMTATVQPLICAYFLAVQRLIDFTTPLEYALNTLTIMFLLPEAYHCHALARALIRSQAVAYFLSVGEDDAEAGAAVSGDWRSRALEKEMQLEKGTKTATAVSHPNAVMAGGGTNIVRSRALASDGDTTAP